MEYLAFLPCYFFISGSTSTVDKFESIVVDLLLFFSFHILNNKVKIGDYFTFYLCSTVKRITCIFSGQCLACG